MIKPFGFYGITQPNVLTLEATLGSALSALPENERRTIAADILLDDRTLLEHCKRERTVVNTLSQLPRDMQLAAVRAIINTL